MTPFAEELKRSRQAAGFKTASSFFELLKGKGIGFNYSYYMRLEQGGLPSEKVVNEIASSVKKDQGDRLILAYCQSLFPKQGYLFTQNQAEEEPVDEPAPRESSSAAPQGQKELTPRQVAALVHNEATYHLFLLSTLARRAVRTNEVEKWYSPKTLNASLKILSEAGLVSVSKGAFEHTAVELRFPEAYNTELKEAYAKLDSWDESFGKKSGLEQLINKMIVRRVSGRYLALVRKQLDVLFELTKTSDEVDQRYNENVLQLKVSLRQGKLPG
ncbi:MAG: hypothetical protein ACXVB9_01460 [Bdellovibrionota bacterium]